MGIKTTGPIQGRKNVRILTADTTLTIEDSGTVFFLDATGENIIIPAASTAKGVYYEFVVNATVATSSWSIDSAGTNDLHINAFTGADGAAAASSAGTSVDGYNHVHTSAVAGDCSYMISDGTKWHAIGFSSLVASIVEP